MRFPKSVSGTTTRIVQDGQGILWLGTVRGGLWSFNPKSDHFTAYKHDDTTQLGLSNDHVNALLIDESGILWVGTQNGLDKFDLGTRTFVASYRETDGMADDAVQGIQEDGQNNLWISTKKGLSRFQPRTGRFTSFYGSDGLAGDDFSVLFPVSFKSSRGEMFFGGVDGVTSFYPDQVDEGGNSYVPPVVLTEFRINNIPVSVGGNSRLKRAISFESDLTLSYKENIFSLTFSSLSYFNPSRNRYRYRLEGLESVWNETGSDRRFVSYTTLPPGNYVFHVQGSNNLDVWNEKGVSVNIHVSPPWWSALWFRIVSITLLVLAAWIGHKYRLRIISRQLNLRADDRLAERTRIARELHDTLLQGFLSASMQVHVANDCLPGDSLVKPTLTRALQVMDQVIEEGRNAVRGLRSPHSASLDLEHAFSRIKHELIPEGDANAQIAFRVIVEGKPRPLNTALRDELYRIGREALTNAFRHAKANCIELQLTYSSNGLKILVRDDGCGIDPQILRSGCAGHWGLSGIRERADGIGAQLRVFSGAAGTEIELSVPSHIAFQDHRNHTFTWLGKHFWRRSGSQQLVRKKE